MKFDVLKSQTAYCKPSNPSRSDHLKPPTLKGKPPVLEHARLPLQSKLGKVTSDLNIPKYFNEEQQNRLGSSVFIPIAIDYRPSNKPMLPTDKLVEKIRTNIGLLQSKINQLFGQQIQEDGNTANLITDQRTTEPTDKDNGRLERENNFMDMPKKDKGKKPEKTSRASQNKSQKQGKAASSLHRS